MAADVPGLGATLEKIEEYGITREDAAQIAGRLELAAIDVASKQAGGDLGLKDAVQAFLRGLKEELYKELCDPQRKALKAQYNDLLNKGLTADGIQAVAAVVSKIVAAINPAYLVSSVVVYASIWLLKIGLNHWCALPAPADAK